MTPRRETCRWVFRGYVVTRSVTWMEWSTECGDSEWRNNTAGDCPHCGGRIVREEGE